jgi:hypothetical protein
VRFGDGSRPGTPILVVGEVSVAAGATPLTPEEATAVAFWRKAFVAAAAEVRAHH